MFYECDFKLDTLSDISPRVSANGGDKTIENILPIVLKQIGIAFPRGNPAVKFLKVIGRDDYFRVP
jgi:hypothetical protein